MTDDDDEQLDSDEAEGPDPGSPEWHEQFDAAATELKSRCATFDITVTDGMNWDELPLLYVAVPYGREFRNVCVYDADSIRRLLSLSFEKLSFVGKYLAVCSYDAGTIEAGIRFLSQPATNRLFGSPDWPEDDPADRVISVLDEGSGTRLSISPASSAFEVFAYRGGVVARRLGTLKIEGLKFSRQNEAIELLERLSDAFFFQIDVSRGTALRLVLDRRCRRVARRGNPTDERDLEFPKNEYDTPPMALYWYGRGANGMPLLQFLAFYQVIEYYFRTYSRSEAARRIRAIIKDPSFRIDRDDDIGRILRFMDSGGGFGDERSQLRATIHECVDLLSLREFLTEDDEREQFFSKKGAENLTDKKLTIGNPDIDLRNEVADRIYDIRCKIVHSKGSTRGGEIELLLPFSPEAELLAFDIELVHFVSKKVLVAASSPLRV